MTEPSELYDRYARPILDQALLDIHPPYEQPWERAVFAAGRNLAFADRVEWRLNAAALIAAHAIRLVRAGSTLDDIAWNLGDRDPDNRIDAANAIRRERDDPTVILVWRWLSATSDRAEATCGHLARHVATNITDYRQLLAPAWYATAGWYLLGALGRADPTPGPMSTDDRAALVPAVRGCWTSGVWTKTDLAARAGISRPTLDSWIG